MQPRRPHFVGSEPTAAVPWNPGRRSWRRILLALPPAAFLVLLLVIGREPAISQPVAFNHLKHTVDLQLGCEFCHLYVTTGGHAGLPGNEICAYCHLTPQGESAEAARLTDLLNTGTRVRFNKLFRLPDHVYYTHRRHVGVAGLQCTSCHGSIATTERPPERPLVSIDMAFCRNCHRERAQSQDCNACHR